MQVQPGKIFICHLASFYVVSLAKRLERFDGIIRLYDQVRHVSQLVDLDTNRHQLLFVGPTLNDFEKRECNFTSHDIKHTTRSFILDYKKRFEQCTVFGMNIPQVRGTFALSTLLWSSVRKLRSLTKWGSLSALINSATCSLLGRGDVWFC